MRYIQKLCLLLTMLFCLQQTYTQNKISPKWLINSEGDSWDVISDMLCDDNKHIFICGTFSGNTHFGMRAEQLSGENSIFIAKVDDKGENIWMNQVQSTDYCYSASMCYDSEGSLYLFGHFRGDLILEKNPISSPNRKSAFIIKFDVNGQQKWVKHIKGNLLHQNAFVRINNEDELVFAATHKGNIVMGDKTFEGDPYADILILQFEKKGLLKNSKSLPGTDDLLIYDLMIDQRGTIHITGAFKKSYHTQNEILLSKGRKDIFLTLLDENLEEIYSKQFGGYYDDYAKSIRKDALGNIIISGCFSGEFTLGENYLFRSEGNLDAFVLKLNPDGEILWSNQIGGPADDYLTSMVVNSNNDVYISGTYKLAIQKDDLNIRSVFNSPDIFLAKFDELGKFCFVESVGDSNLDFSRKLVIDNEDYLYLSGNFNKSTRLRNYQSQNSIAEDFFLAKIYDCAGTQQVELPDDMEICGDEISLEVDDDYVKYLWNGNSGGPKFTTGSSGDLALQVTDKHGCMSVDTFHIQLNKPYDFDLGEPIEVVHGETITLEAPEGLDTYQWNDYSTLSYLDIKTEYVEVGEHQYYVVITDEFNCPSADSIMVTILDNNLSINEELSLNGNFAASVYPNPTKDKVKLSLANINTDKTLGLILLTLSGEKVWSKQLDNRSQKLAMDLDMITLNPGTYILLVKNGTASLEKRIVVVK